MRVAADSEIVIMEIEAVIKEILCIKIRFKYTGKFLHRKVCFDESPLGICLVGVKFTFEQSRNFDMMHEIAVVEFGYIDGRYHDDRVCCRPY
jgi:hypothetical protein